MRMGAPPREAKVVYRKHVRRQARRLSHSVRCVELADFERTRLGILQRAWSPICVHNCRVKRNTRKMVCGTLRDFQIREALSKELMHKHASSPDTVVLEEFGCKEARADLAVVNGALHCYEIKSGRDRLCRLSKQIPAYSAIFDNVTLVVERNHLLKAREVIPSWWGIVLAIEQCNTVTFKTIRSGRSNIRLSGIMLAKMLWRDEAIRLLRLQTPRTELAKTPVSEIWQAIAESLPAETISAALRQAIKSRGGSGFRPPLMQNGDSFPKQSNFQHCRVLAADRH